MTEAMAKNRQLAELLGWENIVDVGGAWLGMPPADIPASRGQAKVPDWAGDWRHCGPLMVQHLSALRLYEAWGVASAALLFDLAQKLGDGASRDTATRTLIVETVIAKLEALR